MNKLVVFDLDGTLLETNEIDSECYAIACRDVLDVDLSTVAWNEFQHVTDSAIARQLLMLSPKRVDADALERMKHAFCELLATAASSSPHRFQPVAGAESILDYLSSVGWGAAIATGAWKRSAEIKIAAAGAFLNSIPIATADDDLSREKIVRHAAQLAADRYAVTRFTRIVAVGDGPWDVQTAHQLKLPFVGIGRDWRREGLLACGASRVVEDLQDFAAFGDALEHAIVPEWTPLKLLAR